MGRLHFRKCGALALLWERLQIGEHGLLRSAQVRIGTLVVPWSRAIAGVLFIVMGVSFVIFQGSSALSGV